MVFETKRLIIQKATVADVDMYFRLWNHPEVMVNVGFPKGLGISKEKIIDQFNRQNETNYDRCLIVHRRTDGTAIGECKLGFPDDNGVSSTDVKLFPEFWNQGYGTEIKQGLVDYLFANVPQCMAVKADPAKSNIGSQKMQEHVGAIRIEAGKDYPVKGAEKHIPDEEHYLYMVFREKKGD